MKKILALVCAISLFASVMLMSGCGDKDNTVQQGNTVATAAAGGSGDSVVTNMAPDKNGKINASLLDENNSFESFSPDDEFHQHPLVSYQCEDDGTVITGDIYEYDDNFNETKRVHYEGKVLDYTEVREYNDKNQNTKIISYVGEISRQNLVSTCVLTYDEHGNEIKSVTYDGENALYGYDITDYVKVGNDYLINSCTSYDSNKVMLEKTEYSYREDGTTSKDIRTVYDENGEVYYYCQSAYDSSGTAISYTYYDKNKKKIDPPEEEADAYAE